MTNPQLASAGGTQPSASGGVSAGFAKKGGQAVNQATDVAAGAGMGWVDDGLSHTRQHVHWVVTSSVHGVDQSGNQHAFMQHDLMAPDQETALKLARENAPSQHSEFVFRNRVVHHPHPTTVD